MLENNQPNTLQYIGNELELFSHARNWKVYWSSKLSPLLGDPVLEVGTGIGANIKELRGKSGVDWTSVEPDQKLFTQLKVFIDRNFSEEDSVTVINGTIKDIPDGKQFESILYIDVLEHIDNDIDEVSRALNLCKIGGKLIVLAPAHNVLYSAFDKAIGHFRRYDKKMLSQLTPVNGAIVTHYYLDSIGCLASLCNAKLLRSKMPTERQILFWDRIIIPCSRIFDRLVNYSIGKTVVIVWERVS